MNRRQLIRNTFLGASAAAVSSGQTPHQHGIAPLPAQAAAASGGAWTPMLFDNHQNETVVVLSELIIPATDTPGAKAAKVNQYIDLILHDGDLDDRHAFLKGLGWLDGHSIDKHDKPFVGLTEPQQVAILTELDEGKDDSLKAGQAFFRQVKGLTVEGYYTSREGIAELNKGGRVPATFACEHDSHA